MFFIYVLAFKMENYRIHHINDEQILMLSLWPIRLIFISSKATKCCRAPLNFNSPSPQSGINKRPNISTIPPLSLTVYYGSTHRKRLARNGHHMPYRGRWVDNPWRCEAQDVQPFCHRCLELYFAYGKNYVFSHQIYSSSIYSSLYTGITYMFFCTLHKFSSSSLFC